MGYDGVGGQQLNRQQRAFQPPAASHPYERISDKVKNKLSELSLAQSKQYRPIQYQPQQPQRFRHEFPDGRHLYIKDKFTQYKMETDWCKLAESRAMNRSNMNRSAHMNRSAMTRPSPSRFNRSNYDGDTTTTYSCGNPDANSVKLQSENFRYGSPPKQRGKENEVLLNKLLKNLSSKKKQLKNFQSSLSTFSSGKKKGKAKKGKKVSGSKERKGILMNKTMNDNTQLINEKMLDIFKNIGKYLEREGNQLKKLTTKKKQIAFKFK